MFKKLGSLKSAAGVTETLYTAPSSKGVVCNLIMANSDSTSSDTINVFLSGSGEATSLPKNLIMNSDIDSKGLVQLTGLALSDGDYIEVESTNGDVVFTLTGQED